MKIGWIVSTTGCFGAVREYIEISNALIRMGHEVTIYSEGGEPITWLPSLSKVGTFADATLARLDVCISVCDWRWRFFSAWSAVKPKLRAVCVMGFEPTPELGEILRGDVETVASDLRVMREALSMPGVVAVCDSSWQVEWLMKEVGVRCTPPIGGVNLNHFKPTGVRQAKPPFRILATGDPRERKGSVIVRKAFDRINQKKISAELVTYWGKRVPQDELAAWYSNGDVFVDAERRAGWANPVAEAMACGTACVSTNIGAVRDFAVDEETALLVSVDDDAAIANAIVRLLGNESLRKRLAANGVERIKKFDYNTVAEAFATDLKERLSG